MACLYFYYYKVLFKIFTKGESIILAVLKRKTTFAKKSRLNYITVILPGYICCMKCAGLTLHVVVQTGHIQLKACTVHVVPAGSGSCKACSYIL